MPVTANSVLISKSPVRLNSESLPDDLEDVVGKVSCFIIDVKSFFNGSDAAKQKAITEKLELYKKYKKLSAPEKAFVDLTGHEVYSKEDVEKLKRLKGKDFKVYQLHKVAVSEKDHAKILALLKEIQNENPQNYEAVVVSLQKLAQSQKIPKEIRDLINKKLEEIPLEKRNKLQYTKERYEFSKPSSSIPWGKIALGALAVLSVAAVAYGAYYYHDYKLSEQKQKFDDLQNEAVNTCPSKIENPQDNPTCQCSLDTTGFTNDQDLCPGNIDYFTTQCSF